MSSGKHFVDWCVKNGKKHLVKRDLMRRARRMRATILRTKKKFPENHVNDKRRYYREEYLKSDHWKALRAEKLNQHPNCDGCDRTALDVHHLNYRNLYDVTVLDLMSLCRACHAEVHRLMDAGMLRFGKNCPSFIRLGMTRQAIRPEPERPKK